MYILFLHLHVEMGESKQKQHWSRKEDKPESAEPIALLQKLL